MDKLKNSKCAQFLKVAAELEDERLGFSSPGITRWGSHLKLFEKLQSLENSIREMMTIPESTRYVSEDLESIVNSHDFWTNLAQIVRLIHPINDVIISLQSNKSISNVFYHLMKLEVVYQNGSSEFN